MNSNLIGSLSAKDFIVALRNAKSADDKKAAIHCFCGYDVRGLYGAQEAAAVGKATKEIRGGGSVGGMSRGEKRSAYASAAGYVAGMPDARQVAIQNLEGRIRASREEWLEMSRASERTAGEDRSVWLLRMGSEEKKLAGLEQELHQIGG